MPDWTPRNVEIAAEAVAASQFSRFGFDVFVQYGANQPGYDFIVADDTGNTMKVSVKGSKSAGWGLSQSQLTKVGNADYHKAADLWRDRHKPGIVLCLVTFADVSDDQMPRMYLATPAEVAQRLKSASGGVGDTILFENKIRGSRAKGAGTLERLPEEWKLCRARIEQMMLG